jgi:hypothetical protein
LIEIFPIQRIASSDEERARRLRIQFSLIVVYDGSGDRLRRGDKTKGYRAGYKLESLRKRLL